MFYIRKPPHQKVCLVGELSSAAAGVGTSTPEQIAWLPRRAPRDHGLNPQAI